MNSENNNKSMNCSRINRSNIANSSQYSQRFLASPAPSTGLAGGVGVNNNIDLADPDLLNNPEKLMQLEFDEPLLQVATSPTFMQKMVYETELILSNSSIKKIIKDYRNRKVKSKDTQPIVSRMDAIIKKIDTAQEEGLKIYLECKSKPFWDPQSKDRMLSDANEAKVQEWVRILEKFASTYEESISLRYKRTSMAPTSDNDQEAERILQALLRHNQELANASKIFEAIMK